MKIMAISLFLFLGACVTSPSLVQEQVHADSLNRVQAIQQELSKLFAIQQTVLQNIFNNLSKPLWEYDIASADTDEKKAQALIGHQKDQESFNAYIDNLKKLETSILNQLALLEKELKDEL